MKDLRGFSRVTVNTVCNVYIGSKLEITSKLINPLDEIIVLRVNSGESFLE